MKTIVEAGHYYAVNGPTESSIKGWGIGKELASQADAGLALFVDDYHTEQTFLEPGDAFYGSDKVDQLTMMLATEADYVLSESVLANAAPQKMSLLLEEGLVKLKKGILSADGVRLGCLRRLRYYFI